MNRRIFIGKKSTLELFYFLEFAIHQHIRSNKYIPILKLDVLCWPYRINTSENNSYILPETKQGREEWWSCFSYTLFATESTCYGIPNVIAIKRSDIEQGYFVTKGTYERCILCLVNSISLNTIKVRTDTHDIIYIHSMSSRRHVKCRGQSFLRHRHQN